MRWLVAIILLLLAFPASAQTRVQLSWNASTDNVGVAGYNIYRDGVKVGSSATTSFVDQGLTPNTNYSYQVSAFDAAGNESAKSSQITVKTLTQVSGGYPNETTTGVPAGTTLTNYTGPCTITVPNTVIDAKTINCSLTIQATGVQITRSKIIGSIKSDEQSNYSFTVSDVEMDAQGAETGIGAVNYTATRVHMYNMRRGFYCYHNATVRDSYIHGQYTDSTGTAHQSGMRMSQGCTFDHNTITCDAPDVPPDGGCSAGLTGYGDYETVQNNTISNNLFLLTNTGGFCAYGGSSGSKPFPNANNIKFLNNVWQRKANGTRMCGTWGPITDFNPNGSGNVWSNNTWDDGVAINP